MFASRHTVLNYINYPTSMQFSLTDLVKNLNNYITFMPNKYVGFVYKYFICYYTIINLLLRNLQKRFTSK